MNVFQAVKFMLSKDYRSLFFIFLFIFFLIQNISHRSLLTHKNYTKHIIHTGPTHETHKTQITEVNLFVFVYILFHEDFSQILSTNYRSILLSNNQVL